jgi:hypothetical protein
MDQQEGLVAGLSFGSSQETTASHYAKADGSNTVYELSYDFLNNLPEPEEEEKEDEEGTEENHDY